MEVPAANDLAPPETWEIDDLDAAMIRLMLSSEKYPATPSEPSPSLATSSSDDAWDQVDQFLREALHNPRERLSILQMERDIMKFIRDPSQQELVFQQLPTSYLRLAAHRVAQHYNLQSTVLLDNSLPDGSASRIVIRKGSECRFPTTRLVDIPVNLPQQDSNNLRVAIKQRPHKHSPTTNSTGSISSKTNYSKSMEERKEEYNRARERIFSCNSSRGGVAGNSEAEPLAFDNFQQCPLTSIRLEEKPRIVGSEVTLLRSLGDFTASSSTGSRLSRNKGEKESTSRNRATTRVAIFRDRDVDRKDPDYDRSYERYMQTFDPVFGFNGAQCTMQPMYAPVLNYNTEFPQLGSARRPQISIEHQPHSVPQHLRCPWAASSNPAAIGYPAPSERMMAPPPFSPTHVGTSTTSPIHLHSQYTCPHPGVAFVHPAQHVHQSFPQVCRHTSRGWLE